MLPEAEVKGIVEEAFVVGAGVDGDGKTLRGMDTGAGGVDREFPDRDAHSIGAEVAEAEDALAVRDNDDADIGLLPIPQNLRDAAAVGGGDEETAGTAEDVAVELACLADGGGVNEGQHLLDVILKDAVEERLVAVLEGEEKDVTIEGVGLFAKIFQDTGDLVFLGLDARRKEAAKTECVALGFGKGSAFIEGGILENAESPGLGIMFLLHRNGVLGEADLCCCSSNIAASGDWSGTSIVNHRHWIGIGGCRRRVHFSLPEAKART
jgi:hypothetical protein